jgi:hypothetical protein
MKVNRTYLKYIAFALFAVAAVMEAIDHSWALMLISAGLALWAVS